MAVLHERIIAYRFLSGPPGHFSLLVLETLECIIQMAIPLVPMLSFTEPPLRSDERNHRTHQSAFVMRGQLHLAFARTINTELTHQQPRFQR